MELTIMEKQRLTYFKVENFKKFDSLEVEDIGQFNLIVGDNNVGKTCLLEALLFDERPKNTINWYYELLLKRRMTSPMLMLLNEANVETNFEENIFSFYQKNKTKKTIFTIDDKRYSIHNIVEEISTSEKENYQNFVRDTGLFDYEGIRKKSKNWIVFEEEDKIRFLLDLTSSYYEDFINKPENSKIPKVPAVMLNDEIEKYLSIYYDTIFVKNDLGDRIKKLVIELFPNMKILEFQKKVPDLKDRHTQLLVKTENRKEFHNIREYGEGFVRALFSILLILNSNSKKIVIDEIDTGIHYSKMSKFLSIIIRLCKELDVQLFATTHSEECIRKVVNASRELNLQNLVRLIKLKEMKDGQVKAITYPFEEYEYLVQSETEVR